MFLPRSLSYRFSIVGSLCDLIYHLVQMWIWHWCHFMIKSVSYYSDLLIWAKAQIIPLTQKTVYLLLLFFFYGNFSRPISPTVFSVITMKLHSNDCRVATWVAMTFCDVAYDRIWVIFKNTRFYKKTQNSVNIYSFSNLFFLFCSRVQGKAHGPHRHDLSITVYELEAIG